MGRRSRRRKNPDKLVLESGPLDRFSRLDLPWTRPDPKEDSSSGSEGEESLELRFSTRFVFAVNLCLVCMERSSLVCENCRMVSYCGEKHRAEGWSKHGDLCAALAEISSSQDPETIRSLSPQEYRVYRANLLGLLQAELQRPLQLWEREVILYPRVCRLCRDTSMDLRPCERCAMEFTCQGHRTDHQRWCDEFRVYRRCLFLQQRSPEQVEPKIPPVPAPLQDSSCLQSSNFDQLMHQVYQNSGYYRDMDCLAYATLSHVSTIPLTSLYAASLAYPDLQTRETFTIHVIGAEFQFEGINLRVWEKLFLHFQPRLTRLTVLLIGPELVLPQGVPLALLSRVRTCRTCRSSGRSVVVRFHPRKCYHEVNPPLPKPDLVCLFNPGLYRDTGFNGLDTWPRTVQEVCRTGAPVLVTSYTQEEIPREISRIGSIADVEVVQQPIRNPYASLKPDRNFVSDDVAPLIYKNYYLTVLKGT